jgi:hypothetical protein
MPGGNGGRLVGFGQSDGMVIWFVWSVSFGWLNETNQMNQIDHAQARCGGAERGRTAASQFCSAPDNPATNDAPARQTTTPEE